MPDCEVGAENIQIVCTAMRIASEGTFEKGGQCRGGSIDLFSSFVPLTFYVSITQTRHFPRRRIPPNALLLWSIPVD